MSVTWVCGPPMGMKIHHGATEITEKTREKLNSVSSVSSVSEPALSEAEGW